MASALSSAFIQGPRSAGVRAEMRLPSTTVASSTQSVPALTMSSRIAPTLVARRRDRNPAGVADEGDRLARAVERPHQIQHGFRAAQLVRCVAARDDQGVEVSL